jgi:mono/diheme cytochrome c family protein
MSPSAILPLVLGLVLLAAPTRSSDTAWVAPDADKARLPPFPSSGAAREKGKALYALHCAICHGQGGGGDGPMAKLHAERTRRAPLDLTDPVVQEAMTDGEIFWKVPTGYRLGDTVIMPAFAGQMPEADRWSLVHFVRSLAAKP